MLRYKNYKLILPSEGQVKKIDELIETKNGSIFHDFTLNNIVRETFNTQLFYLVDNPSNIQNCAPVHVTKNKYGLKRYHFKPLYDIPYAGIIGNELLETNKISIGFFESLIYVGFPYIKNGNQILNNERIGETSMVDLSMDEDEIFNKVIHSKRRNMIRKAVKSGVSTTCFHTIEGLNKFWPILEELHNKLGFSHLSFDYYKRIFQNYASKNQAFILIAFKEDKPISGIFILGNKNFMHYYKGASLFGIKNEGQGELLQWEAIKISKSLDVKYYDLCNLNKEKLPAIYKFKTGISDTIYNYPKFSINNFGYKIMNKLC